MRVHIVDDSDDIRSLLALYCSKVGFESIGWSDPQKFIRHIGELERGDAVILDIMMPEVDGYEVLSQIRESDPDVPVIMVTARSDMDSVLRCLRLGATDFLPKPIELPRLEANLRSILYANRSQSQPVEGSDEIRKEHIQGILAATSPSMQRVSDLALRFAGSSATVLLLGESGTGKEVLAKAMHEVSPRATEPFIAVNCAAIPSTLLESELFGYVKGAFTGANTDRAGKFEAAGRGTIFLDEIGELSKEGQVKLLRVLQERRIMRVGGNVEQPFEARVLCATNRNLESAVKEGTFREDLYFRIATLQISNPPLRERSEDLRTLVDGFVKRISKREGKRVRGVGKHAFTLLEDYHWPGNIRQLQHCIEYAVVLCEGISLQVEDFPDYLRESTGISASLESVDSEGTSDSPLVPQGGLHLNFSSPKGIPNWSIIEHLIVSHALEACDGSVTELARRLGVSRGWIYRRLEAMAGAQSKQFA